ncbi:Uncharacterised protein [Mycobacteroides abscessus subsp. abscessus]|nr:Uncharacterised protein [Mycobacteroides abscessus subsp. abscessus]
MSDAASAWISRMFSSPGIPKTTETPSFSKHFTINWAAVLIFPTVVARWRHAYRNDQPGHRRDDQDLFSGVRRGNRRGHRTRT